MINNFGQSQDNVNIQNNDVSIKSNTMIRCQIIDVHECDHLGNYTGASDLKKYKINLFCKIAEGSFYDSPQLNTICVRVIGYTPTLDVLKNKDETLDDFMQSIASDIIVHINYVTLEHSQLFRGYNKEVECIRLHFTTLYGYKKTKFYLKKEDRVLCDCDVPPFFRFFHSKNIRLCDWISVDRYLEIFKTADRISSCDKEVEVNIKNVNACLDFGEKISHLLIASFDIETTTPKKNAFPVFTNKRDHIVQIATTFTKYGDSKYIQQHIVTLGPCNPIQGVSVFKPEMDDDCKNNDEQKKVPCKTKTSAGSVGKHKKVIVVPCDNETQLLAQWAQYIGKMDPDIITGYNILGYDYEYIVQRCIRLKIFDTLFHLSRLREPLSQFQCDQLKMYKSVGEIKGNHQYSLRKLYQHKKMQSSGMGSVSLKYVETVGRINLDLLKYCREQGDKLSSYKLDNVAKHYKLAKGKNDMPYKRIFEIYSHNGSTEEKTEVAKYCLQDTLLCNQLIDKLNVIPNCVGMANTCWIPINYLFTRGQGIKAYSLLLKECTDMGYTIPKIHKRNPMTLQGGFVLTANPGFYEQPVGVLDFASLYPSCMISHNLCTSSILSEDEAKSMNPNTYRVIEWKTPIKLAQIAKLLETDKDEALNAITLWKQDKDDTWLQKHLNITHDQLNIENNVRGLPEISEMHKYYYIREKVHKGIIPMVLQKLLKKRAATKKLLKQCRDPFKKNIYDAYQKSYKITANSIYGQSVSPYIAEVLAKHRNIEFCAKHSNDLPTAVHDAATTGLLNEPNEDPNCP